MKKFLTLLATVVLTACATVRPVPPTPPTPQAFELFVCNETPQQAPYCDAGTAVANAKVELNIAPETFQAMVTDGNGYTAFLDVPPTLNDTYIRVTATGYVPKIVNTTMAVLKSHKYNYIILTSAFPIAPTHAQIQNVKLDFQGTTCHTDQYGDLPWFEAALFSLTPSDRLNIYACKHQHNDTHAIIALGAQPYESVYDEPGQPYQQMHYVGFQEHPDLFAAAVVEVIRNGFIPVVFLGGDGQQGYPVASAQFPILYQALKTGLAGYDLNNYVLYVPGWDGVFYGWDPHDITKFGAQVKQLCFYCQLALEFNTGHLPLGSGPADYTVGGGENGSLWNYDVILAEFNDANLHEDSTWQVLARLLGPAYKRPSEQPSGDDPNPPFYLKDWPGSSVCFEYGEYEWVRLTFTLAHIQEMRAYLYTLGCKVVD